MLLLATALLPRPASAETYRWVDERGAVHYSDNLQSIPERYRAQAQPLSLRGAPSIPATPGGPPPATPGPPAASVPPASARAPGVQASSEYDYYDITGATERELRAQLKLLKPGHAALTNWHISWVYPFATEGGGCTTGPVTVDVKLTFVFPRWHAPPSAPQSLRNKWTAAMQGLERHEDGHKEIVLKAGREILDTLSALPPHASCAQLKQAASAAGHSILDRSRREHEAYDEITKHGATQGAHW